MIYDQSFTILLDQGGPPERITANFKYTVKDSVDQKSWGNLKTS